MGDSWCKVCGDTARFYRMRAQTEMVELCAAIEARKAAPARPAEKDAA